MRVYKVLGPTATGQVGPAGPPFTFAGTMADAKAERLRLTGAQSLKRGEAQDAIAELDIPLSKAEFIAYLNDLVAVLATTGQAPGQTPGGLAAD